MMAGLVVGRLRFPACWRWSGAGLAANERSMAGLRPLRRREGVRVSQQASPRGTFLKIADVVRGQIEADDEMVELPSAADLMRDHRVSRGVALRAFGALQKEGIAEPVPGGRWRVVRRGQVVDHAAVGRTPR